MTGKPTKARLTPGQGLLCAERSLATLPPSALPRESEDPGFFPARRPSVLPKETWALAFARESGKGGIAWLLHAKTILAGLSLALALAACNPAQGPEKPPEPGDRAVARVNGATIWVSDVKREAVAQGLIGQGEPLDVSSDLFRQVLEQVEDRKLLAAEALRRRIDKDAATQRRLAAARERILGDILLENSIGKAVNENAINGLYEEMLKTSTPAEALQLRQIVLASQADADAVRKALLAGGSFDALAAERSRDEATRFKGGMLGPLTSDMLPAGYAAAIKDAKPGDIVGPFHTDAGWVVARLDDRHQETPPTLEAARPQIVRFLTYDQVKDLLLDLRKKAKVETLIAPPPDVPGAPREPASAPTPVTPPASAPAQVPLKK